MASFSAHAHHHPRPNLSPLSCVYLPLQDPVFGFQVPKALKGVPEGVLDPRAAWADKAAYDATRAKLGHMFKKNFEKYVSKDHTDYSPFGPKV